MSLTDKINQVIILAQDPQGGAETADTGGASSVNDAISTITGDFQSMATGILAFCFVIASIVGAFQFKNGGNWQAAFGGAGIILALAIAVGVGPQAVEWFTTIGQNAG